MNRFIARTLLVLAAAFAFALPAHAKRVALVIGNDNYQHVSRLQKAGNDATAMARELQSAGFRVLLHRDLNYRGMVKAVESLTNAVTGGDEVVVFFAGHGVQIRSGSYLLPVDIEASSEAEVEKTSYALNDLMEQLAQAKASFSLVMIDACRDNPLKSKGRSVGATRGLNAPEPPKGQMVVYSASRGQQALDRLSERDANANSVFTREFITRMRKPGVRVDEMMREVQEAVENLARTVSHEQRPAIYNEARGNFYFFGPTTVRVETPGAPPAAALSPEQREDRFWDDAKAAGNREAFEAYIDAYPKGRYASLARANVARLSQAPIAAAQATRESRTAGTPDLRGQWKLIYTSSSGCVFEGALSIATKVSDNEYRGQQSHSLCTGGTITQDARVTIDASGNILIAMSNIRNTGSGGYNADNYHVTLGGDGALSGFNRDSAGNGKAVRFVRMN